VHTPTQRGNHLRTVDLFAGLGDAELEEVAEVAGEIDFEPGTFIARQGQVETGFFLVLRGRVRVVRSGDELAQLGPGEFFGELTVIDQMPRSASVIAIEPTTCLAIASWDLLRLVETKPSIAVALLRELSSRLRRSDDHRH
jgi:CRP/FNR family transcriptional regulator, cyclic AMP receptor protein